MAIEVDGLHDVNLSINPLTHEMMSTAERETTMSYLAHWSYEENGLLCCQHQEIKPNKIICVIRGM